MLERLAKFAIVIVIGVLVAGLAYWVTRERPRTMPPVLYALSEDVIAEFTQKIPRTEVNEVLLLVVQRTNRDEEKQFTKILKKKIEDSNKYKVKDWDDVMKSLSDSLVGKILKETNLVPGEAPKTVKQAKAVLKIMATANYQTDGMMFVTVSEFTEGDEGLNARITLDGQIDRMDPDKAWTIDKTSASVDSRLNYLYMHQKIANSSFIARSFFWVLIAVSLPWGLISLVRAVVKRRKNELNVAMLVGFTLVDVILAWILLCSISFDAWTALILVIVAGALGYLNYDACDYIQRRLT